MFIHHEGISYMIRQIDKLRNINHGYNFEGRSHLEHKEDEWTVFINYVYPKLKQHFKDILEHAQKENLFRELHNYIMKDSLNFLQPNYNLDENHVGEEVKKEDHEMMEHAIALTKHYSAIPRYFKTLDKLISDPKWHYNEETAKKVGDVISDINEHLKEIYHYSMKLAKYYKRILLTLDKENNMRKKYIKDTDHKIHDFEENIRSWINVV